MRTTRPPVVDGLSLALQAASSETSTSTTVTIQASYAIVPDFFNGLLVSALKIPFPGNGDFGSRNSVLAEWGLPQLPKRSRLRGMMTTPCRKGLNPWVELLPEPPLPGNSASYPLTRKY